jgi:hypothetical protein
MALEVAVGPPVLTINNGHTFLVSELDGPTAQANQPVKKGGLVRRRCPRNARLVCLRPKRRERHLRHGRDAG